MKGQFAFWKYDLFPYVLGGKIKSMSLPTHPRHPSDPYKDDKTRTVRYAYVESYGGGFIPIHIAGPKSGCETLFKLQQLRTEYHYAQEALRREFLDKALAVAPFLAKTHPLYQAHVARRNAERRAG